MNTAPLEKLMDEYTSLAKDCFNVDYGDKRALRRNNEAVTKMYSIIENVKNEFGNEGISKFKELLVVDLYHTNLWAATQLLERVALDGTTENSALRIIEKVASGDDVAALGYRHWLKDWKRKKA